MEFVQFMNATGSRWIRNCVYDGGRCADDLVTFAQGHYPAPCIVVNGGNTKYRSRKTGLFSGLTLVLRSENDDILTNLQGELAYTAIEVTVSTDYSYYGSAIFASDVLNMNEMHFARLEKQQMTMISSRDNTCIGLSVHQLGDKFLCLDKCLAQRVNVTCGCVTPTLSHVQDSFASSTCTLLEEWRCNARHANELFVNEGSMEAKCQCSERCHRDKFLVNIASNNLQSKHVRPNETLTIIYVFFNTLSQQVTEQQRSYTFWSLLSDIGGALGLFVGGALFTAAELMDFLLTIIVVKSPCFRRR